MKSIECPSPQNVERVGAPPRERVNEEEPVRRTIYEDSLFYGRSLNLRTGKAVKIPRL